MTRVLFLDESPLCIRVALTENGKLAEIHSEKNTSSAQAEDLYLGRVQAVRASVQAAFVDIGDSLHAFLPLEEGVSPKCGDMLIVQGAAKQSTQTKGMRITAKVNLAGRWLVLLPGQAQVRISKKVKDSALRDALREWGESICPPGCGMIIRTASEDVTQAQLEEEARELYARWQQIEAKAKGRAKPGLLFRRLPLGMRMIRDLRGLDRIVTNSKESFCAYTAAQEEGILPASVQVEYYPEESQLLFDVFGIEPQIEKALNRRVWLPGGGYLIIDPCEALTVIDVNSGKMIIGRDVEETALRVNLEAAAEIARQIRLRDIGGMIIVDFIDMRDAQNRQMLLHEMRVNTSNDRMPVNVEGITRLGLMEMTRKRVQEPLHTRMRVSCSYCSGNGALISAEETAHRAIRQVRRMALSGQRGPFIVRCAPPAAQILSGFTNPLAHGQIYVLPVQGKHSEKYDIEQIAEGASLPKEALLLRTLHQCED